MSRRGRKNYRVEPLIVPKVLNFLKENPVASVKEIVNHLQRTYPSYRRKAYGALSVSVSKVLATEVTGITAAPTPEEQYQMKTAAKRKRNDIDASSGSEEEWSSSEDMDVIEPVYMEESQMEGFSANQYLRNTYKKSTTTTTKPSVSKLVKKRATKLSKKQHKDDSSKEQENNNAGIPHYLTSNSSTVHVAASRPVERYTDVGGIERVLNQLHETIERPLRYPEIYAHLGVQPPRGVLLHGPPGCGKTLLAHAIAGELGIPFIKLSAPEIVSGVSGESEATLRKIFAEAIRIAPALIFIDEIDAICPKRESASREMERRIVAQLLSSLDDISLDRTEGKAVIVLGATNRPDAIDSALRRAGRFDREICLGVPDEKAREGILRTLCKKLRLEGEFNYTQIARLTPGFVGADLTSLLHEAANVAINRICSDIEVKNKEKKEEEEMEVKVMEMELGLDANVNVVENANDNDHDAMDCEVVVVKSGNDITTPALSTINADVVATTPPNATPPNATPPSVTPISPRDNVSTSSSRIKYLSPEELCTLSIIMNDFITAIPEVQPSSKREGFAAIPDVSWDNVGALENVRKELEMALLAPIKHREKFNAVGLQSSSCGVLLYGPPGCGKTLLAKVMANQCQLNFLSVKGPELLNKYVGESERAVRTTFSRARASSPCIIFFDELDSLCPRRSGGSENHSSQRVVNQMLTEMDGLDSRKDIFVIAATNRPDMIDPAILRPGRLDKLIYIPLPSPADRVKILLTCSRNTPLDSNVSLEKIALSDKCNGFSGADLELLNKEASAQCLDGAIYHDKPLIVTMQHFEEALQKVSPSVTIKDEKAYARINTSLAQGRIRKPEQDQQTAK